MNYIIEVVVINFELPISEEKCKIRNTITCMCPDF